MNNQDHHHDHEEPYSIVIDGYSQTLVEPDPNTVTLICGCLVDLVNNNEIQGSNIKPGSRYRYRFTVPLPINDCYRTGSLMIEAGARLPGIADLRIEFKPAKTESNGVADVIALLDSITPFGGQHFITNGVVTRLDIAIDLSGVTVPDVIIYSEGTRKSAVYCDRRGQPETLYIGTPRSNRTICYTKLHKETGRRFLRIERRLKRRWLGHELPAMEDPFRKLHLVHIDSFLGLLTGQIPEYFFDSVRIRGFSHALTYLPPAERRAIKAVLKNPAQSILPCTGTIWRSWPRLLQATGFGFLIAPIASGIQLAPDSAPASLEAMKALTSFEKMQSHDGKDY